MLNISPLLIWHLRYPFGSTMTEFGPTAVSSLVSEADKAKIVSFDV